MPSRWEPFGLSCLEAQAAGRPVLVSDVDGLPEQVAAGGGHIVRGGVEAWRSAFAQPFAPGGAERASGKAREIARSNTQRSRDSWEAILNPPDAPGIQVGSTVTGTPVKIK